MLEKMKIKQECAVCPTKIRDVVGDKFKRNSEYNEAEVVLNNKSKMIVGVCLKHSELKRSDLRSITSKVRKGWLEELAFGVGNEPWVRETGVNLTVVGVTR